jgi:hypothetical protein
MSFIKTSKQLYRQVEALEKETSDHEISMARGELETIADRALATSAMLEGTPDIGNPLPAWVQSKITNACDYITTVHDYLKYSPKLNESVSLDETTFEKIYQMQQDGKSVEDIAKELNLKSDLVKKVLGESKTISEGLSDAQIAQLKKEYEPLKGKTITTSQYQQLKNILFKLQDGDLEKLQKQNIPFASTGAGSILRVRKAPVKITNVTVPGLEGMAEEKIPQDYLDYLRTIVLKNVDFYEVPPKQIIQSWRDEKNKDRFKGKMVDYKEAVDMSKVTKYKMISIKGDQKEITIDREDLEKHLKLGYVIKEPLTEETTFWWHDGKTGYVKAGYDNKELVAWLKKNGYKPEKKEEVEFTEESDKGYNVKYKMKKDDASISMSWYKDKELAQKFLDDVKKSGGNGIITAKEEAELKEGAKRYKEMSNVGTAKYVVSFHDGIKKHNDGSDFFDVEIFKNKEEKNKFITDLDRKGYRPIKYVDEEVELKPVPSLEDSAKKHNVDIEVLKKQLEKGIEIEKEHTNDEKTAEKIALAHIDERPDYYVQIDKLEKKPVEKVAEVKEPTGDLKDACWTGYVAVGTKMKNGKRVPNCVPKSEAYKGAKAIVENAFKKLKEKK